MLGKVHTVIFFLLCGVFINFYDCLAQGPQLGLTFYDLQTRGSMPRNIYVEGNKMYTTWIGNGLDTNFASVGTFFVEYNLDNNSITYKSPARVEPHASRYSVFVKLDNGNLVMLSDSSSVLTKKKDSVNWGEYRKENLFRNGSYPRAGAGGQSIYAVYLANEDYIDTLAGFKRPLLFTKSQNGGLSFDTLRSDFASSAGYDTSKHLGNIKPDQYSMDVNGDNIAILICTETEDVLLLHSTDGGNSWTKELIKAFPINRYKGGITDIDNDGNADTVIASTGQGSVIIDNAGTVHVAWCEVPYVADSLRAHFLSPQLSDYINYWNNRDQDILQLQVLVDWNRDGQFQTGANFTGNGTVRYGNAGYSLHPQLAIDVNNSILLVYAAVTEGDTNDAGVDFRNIYATASYDGVNWTSIFNITNSLSEENVFPSLARRFQGHHYGGFEFAMAYLADFDPGLAVDNKTGHGSSEIRIKRNTKTSVVSNKKNQAEFSIYPNPNNGTFSIIIDKAELNNGSFTLTISDILGNCLLEQEYEVQSHNLGFPIDLPSLASGIYLATLQTKIGIGTKRFIIE
jgi:hypothetical protein